MKFLSDKKILLCRKGSCCPTIESVGNDQFKVCDDYGGSVKLTSDQLSMISEAVEKIEKNHQH